MGEQHNRMTRRVLLVTHEASRSGAPRVATQVASILAKHGDGVSVVSRFPGPMLAEFDAVAPTRVEPLHRIRRRMRSIRRLSRPAWLMDTVVALWEVVRSRANVVYINSTAASIYVRPARWLKRDVILHSHESESVARLFFDAARVPSGLLGVALIACSPTASTSLSQLTGREEDEILTLPSVPNGEYVAGRSLEGAATPLVDEKEIIIGCCGTVEPRKGPDLWVEAARMVLRKRPAQDMRFIWVGDIAEPVEVGPDEPIDFVGPLDNPYAVMRRFDIATLPSRDDPFPLVVLESMLLGNPVVAFGVGGVGHQVGAGGVIVTPGDVTGFADALIRLVDDEGERHRLSLAARERADRLFSSRAFESTLVDFLASRSGVT